MIAACIFTTLLQCRSHYGQNDFKADVRVRSKCEELTLSIEQRVCGPGDVMVIPGGSERWFREDTEVIDFFALRA